MRRVFSTAKAILIKNWSNLAFVIVSSRAIVTIFLIRFGSMRKRTQQKSTINFWNEFSQILIPDTGTKSQFQSVGAWVLYVRGNMSVAKHYSTIWPNHCHPDSKVTKRYVFHIGHIFFFCFQFRLRVLLALILWMFGMSYKAGDNSCFRCFCFSEGMINFVTTCSCGKHWVSLTWL